MHRHAATHRARYDSPNVKSFAPIMLATMLAVRSLCAGETALSALQGLPKADARNVVRIAARDGLAAPEHWYFTVYDPAARSSLRVLVVAKGEVVTSQDVSPTEASGLSKELLDTIKVDSDQVANLALSYAAASQMKVSFLDYELARQGARAVPVWVVTCLDQNSKPLGSLVITASKGNVVASEGFTHQPGAAPVAPTAAANPVTGIDPRIAQSDRDFLESQKGAEPPPIAAPGPGLPPLTEADEWKARAESRPPIVVSKGKTKATPTPVRVPGRKYGPLPPAEYEVAPPDYDEEEDDDNVWQERELTHRRPPPVFSSKGDLSREVRRIRGIIHRILPF